MAGLFLFLAEFLYASAVVAPIFPSLIFIQRLFPPAFSYSVNVPMLLRSSFFSLFALPEQAIRLDVNIPDISYPNKLVMSIRSEFCFVWRIWAPPVCSVSRVCIHRFL